MGYIESLIGLERGTILQNDQKSRDGFPKLWYAVKILYIPFQVRTRSSNKWLPQLLSFGDGKGWGASWNGDRYSYTKNRPYELLQMINIQHMMMDNYQQMVAVRLDWYSSWEVGPWWTWRTGVRGNNWTTSCLSRCKDLLRDSDSTSCLWGYKDLFRG